MANEVVYVTVTEPSTTPINVGVTAPTPDITDVLLSDFEGFNFVQNTTPTGISDGQTWYKPSDNTAKVWYSGQWISFGGPIITTWTTPTFNTNWIDHTPGFKYRKIGDVVYVQGAVQWTGGAVGTGAQIVTTLPVGFRPTSIRRFTGWQNNAGIAVRCTIDTAGVVTIDDALATSRSWELSLIVSTTA